MNRFYCYLYFLILWGKILDVSAQTEYNLSSTNSPLFLITDSLKDSNGLERFINIHLSKNKPSLAKVMRDSVNYPFQRNLNNQLNLIAQNPNDGYWIYFKIANTNDYQVDLMLEFANPLLKELEFFEMKEKIERHRHTGTQLPFASRMFNHHNFIFPLYFKPKEQKDFYVYLNNSGLSTFIPIHLVKPNFFWQDSLLHQTKLGAYMMFIILMSVAILFLFIRVKNILVGYLGLYIFFLGLYALNKTGFAFQFFWSNVPILAQNADILISLSVTLISLRLIFHFLEEYEYSDISLGFVRLPIYIFTFLLIFAILIVYFENNWAYFILEHISFWGLLGSQFSIILSFFIVLIRRENEQKIWLLICILLLLLPFIYFISFGMNTNFYQSNLFLYETIFMIFSLVLIIIHPIKYFRNEKKLEIFASIKKMLK